MINPTSDPLSRIERKLILLHWLLAVEFILTLAFLVMV